MVMIEFQNATKLYKTVIGINDVTLSLQPGAYGLLGPNGSGKTTLINLITGQLRPTVGTVRVFGKDPWSKDGLLRNIGICPAIDLLLPTTSAIEWVTYMTRMHGLSMRDSRSKAEKALGLVGMTYAMNRPIGNYSLGMRQRTKLAQALAHDPDLLILDEPFNGLDPIARYDMSQLLLEWIKDGKSLMLASHILHEVEEINPSFLLMSNGRLLASGSADEVHSLLSDLPNEIHIDVDRPKELAQQIIGNDAISSVRFDEAKQSLSFTTNRSTYVFEQMPQWFLNCEAEIGAVRSSDQSLQQLFTTLVKMHRGEL